MGIGNINIPLNRLIVQASNVPHKWDHSDHDVRGTSGYRFERNKKKNIYINM